MSPKEPKHKRSSLLALGSAAVIAVYAAGFERTKSAAAAFADEDAVRRPAPPMAPAALVVDSGLLAKPIVAQPVALPPITPKKATVAAKPIADTAASVIAVVVPTPVKDTAPTPAIMQAPDTSIALPDTTPVVKVVYKDGKYTGWGTSRHGDIEAGVEIKDGKITAAYITQCLTRYSCSWIDRLPGQVVSRQSAETDLISGATQSSNAFYYAVLQALGKAK